MNKRIATIAAAGALAFGVFQAHATQYRDADAVGATLPVFDLGNPLANRYSGSFDIKNADGTSSFTVQAPFDAGSHLSETYTSALGFNPLTEHVVSGTVDFWFHSTENDNFTVALDINTILVESLTGPIVFEHKGLNASLIASLQNDGIINYEVVNTGPTDIIFDYAALTANVPDGGATAMLLGMGFLGLGAFARRKA